MISDSGVTSLFFLTACAVSLLIFYVSARVVWRQVVLGSLGITVVVSQASTVTPLAIVLLFPLVSCCLTLAISRLPSDSLLLLAVSSVIGFFVVVKQYWFVPDFESLNIFMTVGLSYMFFRTIHVLVEVKSGLPFGFADIGSYLRYQLSPFNFFAGPINNFEDYLEDEQAIGSVSLSDDIVCNGVSRILCGLIKVIALSQLFLSGFWMFNGLGDFYYVPASLLFIAHLYINFSGYMDIVIGLGSLFGIRVPENFNRPWMASNFTDFWSRWHITLSFFFRDYVFYPLMKMVAQKTALRSVRVVCGSLVSFLAFFLLGVWHGTGLTFIYLGIALGSGVAVNYFFSEFKLKAKAQNNDDKGFWGRCWSELSGALAVVYFAIVSTIVWPNISGLNQAIDSASSILTREGLFGLIVSCISIIIIRFLTLWFDKLRTVLRPSVALLRPIAIGGLLVFTFLLYEITSSAPPPHVYYEDF